MRVDISLSRLYFPINAPLGATGKCDVWLHVHFVGKLLDQWLVEDFVYDYLLYRFTFNCPDHW